jgi:hypothetical protein
MHCTVLYNILYVLHRTCGKDIQYKKTSKGLMKKGVAYSWPESRAWLEELKLIRRWLELDLLPIKLFITACVHCAGIKQKRGGSNAAAHHT